MSVEKVLYVSEKEKEKILSNRNKIDVLKDVTILKEWLKKQPHLPQDIREDLLEKMLRLNKYSLEKTKKKIDTYYSCKGLVPEFFTDRDPLSKECQEYWNSLTVLPLPNLTDDLSRIYMFRIENPDPERFDLMTHIKCLFILFDLRLHFDLADSEIIVVDMSNFLLGHMKKLSPVLIKKALTIMTVRIACPKLTVMGSDDLERVPSLGLEKKNVEIREIKKAYSDRLRGWHLLYMPSYAMPFLNLIQLVLKDKIAGRIQAHPDLESLYKVVPRKYLPSDYNGEQRPIKELFAEWREFVESKNKWLMEEANIRANEALRIGEPFDEDFFGSVHGSFRTLSLD